MFSVQLDNGITTWLNQNGYFDWKENWKYEAYYFVLFKFTHVIFHAYPLENKCKIKEQVEQNQYYHVHRNKSKIKTKRD